MRTPSAPDWCSYWSATFDREKHIARGRGGGREEEMEGWERGVKEGGERENKGEE